MLDDLDKQIIAALQGEFPLVADPYRVLAERIGIDQSELLQRLQHYRETGALRKMGAVLRHREVGYMANALCAWEVSPDIVDDIGRRVAANPLVTHCYARIAQPPAWPYNFFAMLHAHTREECARVAAELSRQVGLNDCIMLYSTREWKKTSMRYFKEDQQDA